MASRLREQAPVKAFVVDPAVEVLHEGIPRRLAGRDVKSSKLRPGSGADEPSL